nr:EOG090X0CTK [Lepidurus arcticus]
MTLYHFGNCLALAYIPYFITYKYSGLSEYGAFWKCVQAGVIYALTQLVKMLILATFFPSLDTGDESQLSILSELLRCTVDLADLFGLSFIMSRVAGKGNTKILIAGVGWAAAEFIFSKLAILWFGARGTEFNIVYIQKSLESNISLVHFIALTTLVWLSSRNDLPRQFFPAVVLLVLLATYEPLLLHIVFHELIIGPRSIGFTKLCYSLWAVKTFHFYLYRSTGTSILNDKGRKRHRLFDSNIIQILRERNV